MSSILRACVLLSTLSPFPLAAQLMTSADVSTVIAQATTRAAQISPNAVVAVVDREGYVLGVWSTSTNFNDGIVSNAIAKAGTAAFLSSDQHAFTSRTAGFIVQQNFPPGVQNKGPGPLVGVNFSNLPFSDINHFKTPAGYNPAVTNGINGGFVGAPVTGGLAGTPGGVPLYHAGLLVGGVGVASTNGLSPTNVSPATVIDPNTDEDVALAGQVGFGPAPEIFGSHVFVGGIRLEYVESTTFLTFVPPLGSYGAVVPGFPISDSPPVRYSPITIGGVTGELRIPIIDDPSIAPLPGATPRLTAAEVTSVLAAAANRVRTTRAGIRLPRGSRMQAFICVVNNPAVDQSPPVVLGSICTSPDATRFSWDVSVQKARTAVFFSSEGRAFSSRTVGFMAQADYPPGIANTSTGIFLGLQERFSLFPKGVYNPLNGALVTTDPGPIPGQANGNLPNGITIFPGGFPLYRNGVLIGAIGVSGDGIDQDDLVAATGASLFPAPDNIRADRDLYRAARLPYAKFPRNPAL